MDFKNGVFFGIIPYFLTMAMLNPTIPSKSGVNAAMVDKKRILY